MYVSLGNNLYVSLNNIYVSLNMIMIIDQDCDDPQKPIMIGRIVKNHLVHVSPWSDEKYEIH